MKRSLFGLYVAFVMTATYCDAVPARAQGLAGEYQVTKQATWENAQFHNGKYDYGEEAFYVSPTGEVFSVTKKGAVERLGSIKQVERKSQSIHMYNSAYELQYAVEGNELVKYTKTLLSTGINPLSFGSGSVSTITTTGNGTVSRNVVAVRRNIQNEELNRQAYLEEQRQKKLQEQMKAEQERLERAQQEAIAAQERAEQEKIRNAEIEKQRRDQQAQEAVTRILGTGLGIYQMFK